MPLLRPIDAKHIGKLLEELGEATAAASRCLIQGINECEPHTGKLNKHWLEEELADVAANISLVVQHFQLDFDRMQARTEIKKKRLRRWHQMLP